jgi:membrane-bound metal-dependent hydrolase YbcI (DUF457 family)
MDPLSHVVIGRALTAAVDDDIERFGRGGGAAAILGALAPDVDGILIPFGWDIYLRAHEIGTHSIAGCALVACASAAIVRALTRRSRYVPLAAAAATGAMSHLALDVLSGARIRIGWPFLDARVTVPVVPMADPWFVAICVAGLCVYWGRRRGRTVARAVLVAAAGLLCVKGILLERMVRSSTKAGDISVRPRGALGVVHRVERVRTDAADASRVAREQPRQTCGADRIAAAGSGVGARQSVAIARYRQQLSAHARLRFPRRAINGRRHVCLVVGSAVLLAHGAVAGFNELRALVRRDLRTRRLRPHPGGEGKGVGPDALGFTVRRNSAFANGVRPAMGHVSAWKPQRAKQARHWSPVRA